MRLQFGGRREEAIWDLEDAPEYEFVSLPPYRLTRRVKSWVQDLLDSREVSIGVRLIPDWADHRNQVLELVSDSYIAFKDPKRAVFMLSPVHGDLNSENILLWLNYDKYPFLIDLPFNQKDGHVLQDFARLEVEINLALLDRQEETPASELAGYDYSLSQIPLWLEMEKHLLRQVGLIENGASNLNTKDHGFESDGYKENVRLCYKLVTTLREKACLIQQRPLNGVLAAKTFQDEYLPPLLYHYVRAITYPSLSIFRRLIAVYVSAAILRQIGR